jgi:hypothetical protein
VQRTSILVAFIAAAFLSNAIAKREPTVYFKSPCTCENDHMSDRKEAKGEWAAIPTRASMFKTVKPSDMYRWPPLAGLNEQSPRKKPEEEQWYKVTGQVVDVRTQADGDIHFELRDATGTKRGHILAEVPVARPWCDLRKVVFSWTTKGTRFRRFQPSQLTLRMHPVVTLTGKAFFDTHHARKNPLRNISNNNKSGILAAWEIHPVSAITADRSVIPDEVLGNHR